MEAETFKACEHCGALVFGDTKKCPQCGRFPIKLHFCMHCKMVAPKDSTRCMRCLRVFEPDGDYL